MANIEVIYAPKKLSARSHIFWAVDSILLLSAFVATLSGIYFLFLPSGYQGGRNPYYDLNILFSRTTWDTLHTWSGIVMIAAAIIHHSLHFDWYFKMFRRIVFSSRDQKQSLKINVHLNFWNNSIIAIGFIISSISGLYFLFDEYRLGTVGQFLTGTEWDLIHTWSSIIVIIAAELHILIHWRWIRNITKKIFSKTL
jgi:hypothetical protein